MCYLKRVLNNIVYVVALRDKAEFCLLSFIHFRLMQIFNCFKARRGRFDSILVLFFNSILHYCLGNLLTLS